jgi:hypothetical protein
VVVGVQHFLECWLLPHFHSHSRFWCHFELLSVSLEMLQGEQEEQVGVDELDLEGLYLVEQQWLHVGV